MFDSFMRCSIKLFVGMLLTVPDFGVPSAAVDVHLGRNIHHPQDGEKVFGARGGFVVQLNCSSGLENQIIEHHHAGE